MFSSYISIIVSLFILEVLLSIDNALVNATLAEALPEHKRIKAIRIGIVLGAVFRLVALFFVALIIQNVWLKVLGALYLIYLAMVHLGKIVDDEGNLHIGKTTFRGVITQIALADIVFSIDNVIGAVSFSSNINIVMLGVMIGVMSMLFITPILSRVIHAYKGMTQAAYVIVGGIGGLLLLETLTHIHIGELSKFLGIIVILGFTIWYEHSKILRAATTPLLRKAQYAIALPLDVIYGLFNLIRSVAK
jgi:YkoY family integral membrane protein